MAAPAATVDDLILTQCKAVIRERCGLVISNDAPLVKALLQRGGGGNAAPAYLARLTQDEEEFHELVSLITINETYFHREPETLRLLVERLLPRLLATFPPPLAILSAGCATGEEPYSLAMLLKEAHGPGWHRLFRILAVDIDAPALARARQARYGPLSFRGLPEETRRRHFQGDDKGLFTLDPELSRQVTFQQVNLLANPLPATLQGQHVILFRNVSIYFDVATRATIHARLTGLLHRPGYLLVGAAETLSNHFGLLDLVEENGLFYFANTGGKSLLPRPTRPLPAFEARLAPRPPAPREAPAPTPAPDFPGLLRLVREKRYDQAMPLLEAALSQGDDDIRLHQLKSTVLFHRRQFGEAKAGARRILEIDAWSLDAFLLMGLIHAQEETPEEAIVWFRQAVYVQPGCWEARYHLATLYRQTGQGEKAAREYRILLKQLDSGVATSGLMLPMATPLSEVRTLCQRQLATLHP